MSQILKLTHENQKLKRQINQYQQVLGVSPYVDDSLFKGGYRVVKTVNDRDSIDCCYRKLGMKVLVIGEDLSFKEYILKTDDCKKNIWEEVDITVEGSGNVQVNDKNYVHNQIVASNFWEIQHNLDKYPSVSIVDSGNNLVVGEIKYIDSNNIIITFTSAFSGKAYFN